MTKRSCASVLFLGAMTLALIAGGNQPVMAEDLEAKIPQPVVPEIFTAMGEFVRVAYNNEGWVTLGYRTANDSQGEEWLLLEVGLTLRKGNKDSTLKRWDFSLQAPDGSSYALATQEEFNNANLRALDARAKMVRDSINYFPVGVNDPCVLKFFADAATPGRGIAYDEVELSWQRGCAGRLYFNIPDGITTGQYWLNVKFANSVVQVPFRIMTKEEEHEFRKKWKTMKKEHDASYEQ